jgi:hypothetical protein
MKAAFDEAVNHEDVARRLKLAQEAERADDRFDLSPESGEPIPEEAGYGHGV